jgi:hypothetical protein
MSIAAEPLVVEMPEAGVIEEARARQRRHRGAAGAALLIAVIIAGILLGESGGGGSHPRSASARGGRAPSKTAGRSAPSCGSAQGAALQGAPSKSLLSILGVLRRPAGAADAGSGIVAGGFINRVFVHYIRRARVIAGSPYYIYPAVVGGCGTGERPHQGIMELARNVDLGGGTIGGAGGGGATAVGVEQGQDASSGTPGTSASATVTLVVPDGVAKVILHFPAGQASGYSPKISPAATIATAPVNNLVVVSVPRSNPLQEGTMVWRAANGRIIKRFKTL